jgi:hypothetical protein
MNYGRLIPAIMRCGLRDDNQDLRWWWCPTILPAADNPYELAARDLLVTLYSKIRKRTILRTMLKIGAATPVFGLIHSGLASLTAKRAATNLFGQRSRNGLYRVFYIAQSVVTFGLLATFIRRQRS